MQRTVQVKETTIYEVVVDVENDDLSAIEEKANEIIESGNAEIVYENRTLEE